MMQRLWQQQNEKEETQSASASASLRAKILSRQKRREAAFASLLYPPHFAGAALSLDIPHIEFTFNGLCL